MTPPDGNSNATRAVTGELGAPSAQADAHGSTLRLDPHATPQYTADDLPTAPPPEIEGYHILGRLGEGGMGVVFKAEQVALNRLVAIKLIRSGSLASADDIMRFRIEAEAVARLQHPNIVQIFDFGQQAATRYLSLEFVPGGTLADRIASQPQTPRHAAAVVQLLARAVHTAHLRGIIHRDLKPQNVLLTEDGIPKISDFGLAKFISEQDRQASCMVVGTAEYMAPEQAWGSGLPHEIGPEADVYGLGVILYEMLTGKLPFRGSTPRETLERVWTIPAPSPRALCDRVPRDLETICLKCLEKHPQHRYSSAAELADELDRFLKDEPIHARPVGRIERILKWARRRPAVAAILTLLATALCAIAALTAFYQIRVNTHYRLAKQNLRQAQQAIDELIERASIDGLTPIPKTEGLRRELLTTALSLSQQLQTANPDDADLALQTARARRQMADLYQLLGNFDQARPAYRAALGSLARLADDPAANHQLAITLNNQGNLYRQTGDLTEAENVYTGAIVHWNDLAQADPNNRDVQRGLAAAENNLGLTLNDSGRPDDALEHLRRSETLRRALVDQSPADRDALLDLATTHNNLGLVYRSRGEFADAESALRQAVGLLTNENDPAAPPIPSERFARASARHNLASVLIATSAPDESRALYEQATTELAHLVDDFPEIDLYRSAQAAALNSFGLHLAQSGEPDAAVKHFARAETLYHELAAELHSLDARTSEIQVTARRASALAASGKTGEAEQLSLAAARSGEQLVAENPASVPAALAQSEALSILADRVVERGQKSAARQYREDALRLAKSACPISPHHYAARQNLLERSEALAKLLIELGEPAEAARLAASIAEQFPQQADVRLHSAQVLAQCIPLASGLKDKDQSIDGQPLVDYCRARLQSLVESLPPDERAQLNNTPAFKALEQRGPAYDASK